MLRQEGLAECEALEFNLAASLSRRSRASETGCYRRVNLASANHPLRVAVSQKSQPLHPTVHRFVAGSRSALGAKLFQALGSLRFPNS
ncbi:protein of unknown function [Methylorubrum extorquens]|uniref:Uncharacterized protein n=1 Tax=Methylorubrum extorquens TaxID=408 RepID=A0A2N9AIB6_METEX|nr:protein of unknown function [Methylorubrum extorquens]